jgi:hypothetical protein
MICKECRIDKGDDFRRSRKVCRECENKNAQKIRKKLKEKEKPLFIECKNCEQKKTEFRIGRAVCLDCERKFGREYRRTTDNAKIWTSENKERMSELQHNWYEKNKSTIKENLKIRLKTDPTYRLVIHHRSAIRCLLKGQTKFSKHINCDAARLRDWFQFQFSSNMSWDNYASTCSCDHIIPINEFLNGEEKQETVFHWLNTCPVPKQKNLTKNKYATFEECKDHLEKAKLYIKIRKLEDDSNYIESLERFCDNFAKHLVAGNTSNTSDTTSIEKSLEGTRLIAEPNGNKSDD